MKPYMESVSVNGPPALRPNPDAAHAYITYGGHVDFEVSGARGSWVPGTLVRPTCYQVVPLRLC